MNNPTQFIIEDSNKDCCVFIYLSYSFLGHDGEETPYLQIIDCISISDNQQENHRIALGRVQKIKKAVIMSTSQVLGREYEFGG